LYDGYSFVTPLCRSSFAIPCARCFTPFCALLQHFDRSPGTSLISPSRNLFFPPQFFLMRVPVFSYRSPFWFFGFSGTAPYPPFFRMPAIPRFPCVFAPDVRPLSDCSLDGIRCFLPGVTFFPHRSGRRVMPHTLCPKLFHSSKLVLVHLPRSFYADGFPLAHWL